MRDPSISSVAYEPGDPTTIQDMSDLRRYLKDQETRLQATIMALAAGHMDVTTVAPRKPRDGDFRLCDGVSWAPVGPGVKLPVWYDGTNSTWKVF
jgi:hypothetical protein